MIVLVAGALLGLLFDNVEAVTPGWHPAVAEYLSEVCVIVALMGVGLAIDRPLGWRSWKSTRRLLLADRKSVV